MDLRETILHDDRNADDAQFANTTEQTFSEFKTRHCQYDSFSFFGIQIKTLNVKSFVLHQVHYVNTIEILSKNIEIKIICGACASFSWLVYSRPKHVCVANKSAQAKEY